MYKVFHNESTLFIGANHRNFKGYALTYEQLASLDGFGVLDLLEKSDIAVVTDEPKKVLQQLKGKFKRIVAAGGAVRNAEGELLFILRNGFWDLPKGKLEVDEKKSECAIREVSEECGVKEKHLEITGERYKTYHIFKSKGGNALWKDTYWYPMKFTAKKTKLAPQVEEGISEVGFYPESTILDQEKTPIYPLIRNVIGIVK